MVDIGIRDMECKIIYYETLTKSDIDICLLVANIENKNVIMSKKGISQSMFNYFGNFSHSIIAGDMIYIHKDDLLLYIFDRNIVFEQFKHIKSQFMKYDYEKHCFNETANLLMNNRLNRLRIFQSFSSITRGPDRTRGSDYKKNNNPF